MAKGDFDYARAWRELARPAYDLLPANVRDLYARVAAECRECRQDSALDTVWPPGSDLRSGFEELDAGDLAFASRVIYFLGHWQPSREVAPVPNDHGAHWKFANYADQVLRRRCGLPETRAHGDGIGFEVHEGLLRLCCSYPDGWTWEEVGIATPAFLATCQALSTWPVGKRAKSEAMVAVYEQWLRAIRRLPAADGGHPRLGEFLDKERFIEKGADEAAVDDGLRGTGLRRHALTNVNFKPHPFTIGAQHLANSQSSVLDPDCAPCAQPGCRLSYAEHKSDRVLFIAGAGDALTDGQKAALKALAPVLTEHKIDGLAFVAEEGRQ